MLSTRRGFLGSILALPLLPRAAEVLPLPVSAWDWRTVSTPVYISRVGNPDVVDLLDAKVRQATLNLHEMLTLDNLAREPEPGEQLELFDISLPDEDWDD